MIARPLRGTMDLFFELLSEERRDLPGIDRFPGKFAGGVVPAGKPDDVEWKFVSCASAIASCERSSGNVRS